MTTQEAFNTIVQHLLTQNAKSLNPHFDGSRDDDISCLYRAPDGKQCAIGCLIPDDRYEKSMEGMQAYALANRLPDVFEHVDRAMLIQAQYIHDACAVQAWPSLLRDLARKCYLTYPTI